ncbi:MAG: alpha/beta hydrolase family protein [Acidimicrobiales bacterium]
MNVAGRVDVLSGPGGDVADPAALRLSLRSWGDELDLDVKFRELSTAAGLRASVREAGPDIVGLVLNAAVGPLLRDALASTAVPAVLVSLGLPPDAATGPVVHIRGRGLDGYRWALRHLLAMKAWAPETLAYGPRPDQVADLRRPAGTDRVPVVVLLHGGFWRVKWGRDLMDAVALDLANRGWATWNVDYRRVGSVDGGWPATLTDVASAVDALAPLAPSRRFDLSRVATVGHSAGGQLALWLAGRPRWQPVDVRAVVGLAPICDLAAAAGAGLGHGATEDFMGGPPQQRSDRYRQASPAARLPLGVPQLLVHGDRDGKVPIAMSRDYAAAAASDGDHVELVVATGADHMDVIDPKSAAWAIVGEWLAATL